MSLDELHAVLDFAPAERALAGLYTAAKGEKAWPPLSMFKALLLATWYDLSDVRLAEGFLTGRREFRKRNSRRGASAAFAALPAMKQHLNAPPSCAFAACSPDRGSVKPV